MISSFTTGIPQVDGRVSVTERHDDELGGVHEFTYLSAANADFTATMNARASGLLAVLKRREIERVLGNLEVWTWTYNSNTEMATAFREEYLHSRARRTAELARWLLAGLDDGTFPDAGTRQIFGLTVNQWNTLKTKMGVMRDKLNEIEASAGE